MKQKNNHLQSYFKPHRSLQILSGTLAVVTQLLGLLIIIQIQRIMDLVVQGLSADVPQLDQILRSSSILLISVVVYLIVMFISQLYFRKLSFTSSFGLSLGMIKNMFSLPFSKVNEYGSGELSNRILGDSEYIAGLHGAGKVTLFAELVWLQAALAVMAMYSTWIMIVVVVTILIGLRISKYIQKKIAAITEEFQEVGALVNSSLIEFIQGIDDIKAYHSTAFFYQKMEDLIQGKQEKVANKMTFQYALYIVVNAFRAYALPSIVVISGMVFALRGEMTLGSILALYALTQQIQEPIRMITEMNQD